MNIKTSFLLFTALLTLAVAVSIEKEQGEYTIELDYVPEPIVKCSSGIGNVSCNGNVVCYEYTDTLGTIPCVIKAYGLKGAFKLQLNGLNAKYIVKPGTVVCMHEDEIRKLYSCFDE